MTGTPDGGLKQLLQAKRVSEATINFVMGSNNGRLGFHTPKDFLVWFSKDRDEQEIKYVIDATAETLEGGTSRLRQTWNAARLPVDATAASSSTTAAGLTDQQLEVPLSSE